MSGFCVLNSVMLDDRMGSDERTIVSMRVLSWGIFFGKCGGEDRSVHEKTRPVKDGLFR